MKTKYLIVLLQLGSRKKKITIFLEEKLNGYNCTICKRLDWSPEETARMLLYKLNSCNCTICERLPMVSTEETAKRLFICPNRR